jgi:hypothetical protein
MKHVEQNILDTLLQQKVAEAQYDMPEEHWQIALKALQQQKPKRGLWGYKNTLTTLAVLIAMGTAAYIGNKLVSNTKPSNKPVFGASVIPSLPASKNILPKQKPSSSNSSNIYDKASTQLNKHQVKNAIVPSLKKYKKDIENKSASTPTINTNNITDKELRSTANNDGILLSNSEPSSIQKPTSVIVPTSSKAKKPEAEPVQNLALNNLALNNLNIASSRVESDKDASKKVITKPLPIAKNKAVKIAKVKATKKVNVLMSKAQDPQNIESNYAGAHKIVTSLYNQSEPAKQSINVNAAEATTTNTVANTSTPVFTSSARYVPGLEQYVQHPSTPKAKRNRTYHEDTIAIMPANKQYSMANVVSNDNNTSTNNNIAKNKQQVPSPATTNVAKETVASIAPKHEYFIMPLIATYKGPINVYTLNAYRPQAWLYGAVGTYAYHFNNKWALYSSLGMGYSNGLSFRYSYNKYKSVDSPAYNVFNKGMLQVLMPIAVSYKVGLRHQLMAGGGLAGTVGIYSRETKDATLTSNNNRATWVNTNKAYTLLNAYLQLGYQYQVMRNISLQLMYQQGITDYTKASVQASSTKDYQNRLQAGVVIKLK